MADPESPSVVVLLACVKAKLDRAAPARELYRSPLFRKARSYVEATGYSWFVLSAEHGLIHPQTTIAPYDRTLTSTPASERRAWALRVFDQLNALDPVPSEVWFLAGAAYRQYLVPALQTRGIHVKVPMQHLSIGQQLQWLDRSTKA